MSAFTALFLLAQSAPTPTPMQFHAPTSIVVTDEQSRMWYAAPIFSGCSAGIMLHSYIGYQTHPEHCAPLTRHRVDLSLYGVPRSAKWAFLSGIILASAGTQTHGLNITLTAGRPSHNIDCTRYIAQATAILSAGAVRENAAFFVALENAQFDWCYAVQETTLDGLPPIGYPNNSVHYSAVYGFNFTVQAWGE